jgi:hypothetical protein
MAKIRNEYKILFGKLIGKDKIGMQDDSVEINLT